MLVTNRSLHATSPATIERLERRQLFAANPSVVDVLVVYTPAARSSVGGLDRLTRRVERAVADTNYMLANSRIDATVRLVGLTQTQYTESLHLGNDLTRLQNPGDGFLDSVHALRSSSGADLVHLLVASGDDGGRAYQLDDPSSPWPDYGFAVSQARHTNIEYIFAHETMHSLGAGHDDTDASHRRLPHAYALGVKSGTQVVHTLLGPETRIPYLSSPNLTWRGQSLGASAGSARAQQIGHAADNARAVRTFLPMVAANRPAKIADATAPVARLVQAWVSGGSSLMVQVALADDSAIDVATLDGGDLRVSGPGGFSRAATFVSVDRNTNGGQRLARYTVNISGYAADPARYGFSINAGQIADTGGRTVAGGSPGAGVAVTRFGDRAGPNLHTALDLGTVNGTSRQLADAITDVDPSNFYRFTLTSSATVTARLWNLAADADLRIINDANGNGAVDAKETLATSFAGGTQEERIIKSLAAGVYWMWVSPAGAAQTAYSLAMAVSGGSTAASPASPTSPPPTNQPASPPPVAGGTGSIGGLIWRDNNGNGVRDRWEIALAGWKVFADVNDNGRFDAGADAAATTGADGTFTLANLPASRSYTIRSIEKTGYRRTTAPSRTVGVLPGKLSGGQNFGHTPRVLVTGNVFLDGNGNGLRDAAEAGARGWNIYLDKNGNRRLDAGESWTTADAQGDYAIKDAMAGSYVVRLVNRAGYRATTAPAQPVALAAAEASSRKNFGVRRA